MGVLQRGPAVLFDALFDNAVRHGEHAVNKIRKTVVLGIARSILGGTGRAS